MAAAKLQQTPPGLAGTMLRLEFPGFIAGEAQPVSAAAPQRDVKRCLGAPCPGAHPAGAPRGASGDLWGAPPGYPAALPLSGGSCLCFAISLAESCIQEPDSHLAICLISTKRHRSELPVGTPSSAKKPGEAAHGSWLALTLPEGLEVLQVSIARRGFTLQQLHCSRGHCVKQQTNLKINPISTPRPKRVAG